MKSIKLYDYHELTPKAKHKAIDAVAEDVDIKDLISAEKFDIKKIAKAVLESRFLVDGSFIKLPENMVYIDRSEG